MYAMHDCALGISPVTSYSGVKEVQLARSIEHLLGLDFGSLDRTIPPAHLHTRVHAAGERAVLHRGRRLADVERRLATVHSRVADGARAAHGADAVAAVQVTVMRRLHVTKAALREPEGRLVVPDHHACMHACNRLRNLRSTMPWTPPGPCACVLRPAVLGIDRRFLTRLATDELLLVSVPVASQCIVAAIR